MHMGPQFAALSARARAAEAMQKEQQEQEEQRLREHQQQQERQQQQQDGEQLQGVQGATQAEEEVIVIKCQFKAGELKLRSKPSKKVHEVLKKFKDVLCLEGKGGLLPQDNSAFRIELDGDRLELETTLEEAGVEDGDSLDVMWR
ncbi:hypothetical protein DUNSADRAFT_9421 [Dunaliella salina]|uniref:Rad60/SUMO-like domain-containing protein n=1 Tax=Dunaliella salina TaxID=3046 RepID=A0ABQ7GHI1_DUNSA|nr:hypothetical protein DUNSADRAFT_9421 [Dunaliella salina]|eukprot:KAF5834071.1 hypothetical protein DUNSADRAFT_9421 [Dunaliella salina]